MNSHFSQGSVAESSADTCSGGERSARLSSTTTVAGYSCSARMTDTLKRFQSLATSENSTGDRGLDAWISSLVASRARTSAVQTHGAAESTEREVGSGAKWRGWFVRFDHCLSLWRTPQCSLPGVSDEFLGTWPRSGMMRRGMCWGQKTSALPTIATGCGYWPTPTKRDATRGGAKDWKLKQRAKGKKTGISLTDELGGPSNPTWIEWLMGFPDGWTELAPLETHRFRVWQRQHSLSWLDGQR